MAAILLSPGFARAQIVVTPLGLTSPMAMAATLVGTGITALAQPTQAIGASAFDCLLKRLRGDTAPARTLDTGSPARGSSGR